MKRFWHSSEAKIVWVQMGIAAVMFAISPHAVRGEMLQGTLIGLLSKFMQPLTYLILLLAVVRWLLSIEGRGELKWDGREMLILLPIGGLLACGASQADGTSNSFLTMVLVLLMVPVMEPWGNARGWANASFVTIVMLVGLSGTAYKVQVPYSWFAEVHPPMFEHREWYKHPLYGTMYVNSDLPKFIEPVCSEIWPRGQAKPELLTMPFPYVNYFCGIPPWHQYVQTWFDTVTPATVAKLMNELNTAPPEWIVYERYLYAMHIHEMLFNHGQPSAHRAMDNMIMQKIASGQWTLVDKRNYMKGDDGWYIIETRPARHR
jgi:hypothetical protein